MDPLQITRSRVRRQETMGRPSGIIVLPRTVPPYELEPRQDPKIPTPPSSDLCAENPTVSETNKIRVVMRRTLGLLSVESF
jgi:hypothetical protein